MGCVLCNILHGENSPFRSENQEDEQLFLDELCYDIAQNHSDIVERIEHYRKKIEADKQKISTVTP